MAEQIENGPAGGSDDTETREPRAEQTASRETAGTDGNSPQGRERTASKPEPDKEGGDAAQSGGNLDLVLDIPVQICMELGRTKISIRDLLKLSEGSVVKLERPAGEPLDILVNGCLVARGEVVVTNERFGMRITDIVSTEERVRRLQ